MGAEGAHNFRKYISVSRIFIGFFKALVLSSFSWIVSDLFSFWTVFDPMAGRHCISYSMVVFLLSVCFHSNTALFLYF